MNTIQIDVFSTPICSVCRYIHLIKLKFELHDTLMLILFAVDHGDYDAWHCCKPLTQWLRLGTNITPAEMHF